MSFEKARDAPGRFTFLFIVMSVTTVFQANKSPWLRLGGFSLGVERYGADWLYLISTYFFSWHWELRCRQLRCRHFNKSHSMKGSQAVNSSNIMINIAFSSDSSNHIWFTAPHLSIFLPLNMKSRNQDCAVCQFKIGMRNDDATAKPVLFVQETLNREVCMPVLQPVQ